MSNNNASNNLIIAQRAVKQLRLEASVRRIKVETSRACETNAEDRTELALNGGDPTVAEMTRTGPDWCKSKVLSANEPWNAFGPSEVSVSAVTCNIM